MSNILFIHQSAELYGSDKTLLLLLKYRDRKRYFPVVILPSDGPLKEKLEQQGVKVVLSPVLKLHRNMFKPQNMLLFLKQIREGLNILDKLNKEYQFQIIYSNTLAVLLGIIYAHKRKIKHIWHVHEIIESPKVITKLFLQFLAAKANTKIVYNSIATANFWTVSSRIKAKSIIIQNGIESVEAQISEAKRREIQQQLTHAHDKIIIALIGRISRWKGQSLLVEAFHKLAERKDIHLVFVGSTPPNQEIIQEELEAQISELQLESRITIVPFQNNIDEIWQSIDIAVVPSIEPEPFGLVAVEAMMAKKPVVASNHGGLTEIIAQGETGFLVKPNDVSELAAAIEKLVEDPELRKSFGTNGYLRAMEHFSVQKYTQKLESLFSEMD